MTDAEPTWSARLSTPGSPVCAPDWLELREPADAAARSPELVERLRRHLAGRHLAGRHLAGRHLAGRHFEGRDGTLVVRDLGCGTGSMGRWLADRLPGPQHWILHDRDPELLRRAEVGLPSGVTVETRPGEITDLDATQLAGTSLVTASALLDLLTADEVEGIAAACAATGCPALLTLSVVGAVSLAPADPLDSAYAAAFDAHQRRNVDGRRLLGPDAVEEAAAAFRRHGAQVGTASSPWRLGPDDAELAEEWLRGWLAAACEQRPELAADAEAYLRRRLDAAAGGELRVVVWHEDLLAIPGVVS